MKFDQDLQPKLTGALLARCPCSHWTYWCPILQTRPACTLQAEGSVAGTWV